MENNSVKGAIEAVLFAVAEPISIERISEAVGAEKDEVKTELDNLREQYDNELRGFCLLNYDDRYQLASRATYTIPVTKALDTRRNNPLSPASLETLAIIAYNQPVSRSFIEQVRGVDSSSSVTNLLNKGLIAEAGRLDLPGKPVSFKTTDVFLRCFGMSKLSELPPIHSEDITYEQPVEQTELTEGLINS